MVTKGSHHGLRLRWEQVQESYANWWRHGAAEPRSGYKITDAGHSQSERPRADFTHGPFGTPFFTAQQRGESQGSVEEEMAKDELPWIGVLTVVAVIVVLFGVL